MDELKKVCECFNDYFFSCNLYGHKALDGRHHGRKQVSRYHNSIRCWNCNHVGHIATHCYIMRCYSCGIYGEKSHDCWNSRIQSIISASYNMTTRVKRRYGK
jgi:hypothetical protein